MRLSSKFWQGSQFWADIPDGGHEQGQFRLAGFLQFQVHLNLACLPLRTVTNMFMVTALDD